MVINIAYLIFGYIKKYFRYPSYPSTGFPYASLETHFVLEPRLYEKEKLFRDCNMVVPWPVVIFF